MEMSVCSQVTSRSLSHSVPFAQEPDELWQAGLSGFSPHGSPDQSTALFDRDAENVPRGTREPSVKKSQHPRIKPHCSVNFLNKACGHSRGLLSKQFPQLESGNSTQDHSQKCAFHCQTSQLNFGGVEFSKCCSICVFNQNTISEVKVSVACLCTWTKFFVQLNMQSCLSVQDQNKLNKHVYNEKYVQYDMLIIIVNQIG